MRLLVAYRITKNAHVVQNLLGYLNGQVDMHTKEIFLVIISLELITHIFYVARGQIQNVY